MVVSSEKSRTYNIFIWGGIMSFILILGQSWLFWYNIFPLLLICRSESIAYIYKAIKRLVHFYCHPSPKTTLLKKKKINSNFIFERWSGFYFICNDHHHAALLAIYAASPWNGERPRPDFTNTHTHSKQHSWCGAGERASAACVTRKLTMSLSLSLRPLRAARSNQLHPSNQKTTKK